MTTSAPRDPHIPAAEYEERRHAFTLCHWVNAKLREFAAGDHFDELYFERRDRSVKRLLEEAVPVSRLGLFLATPGSEVHVTCFTDGRPYDATVEVSGFAARTFHVEVTTTETKASTLRRQALARSGQVPLAGPIRRQGREAVWEPEFVNVREEEERRIALVLERLREKVTSGRYEDDTAFLVYETDYLPLRIDARAELVGCLRDYLAREAPRVPAVYVVCQFDYSVVPVR